MIENMIRAALGVILLAGLAVYATISIKNLGRNRSAVYKDTGAYITIIVVCTIGLTGAQYIVTGSLPEFGYNPK